MTEVDSAQLRRAAHALHDVADQVAAARVRHVVGRTRLAAQSRRVEGAWSSAQASRWVRAADAVATRSEPVAATLEGVERALSSLASSTETIATELAAAEGELAVTEREIRDLASAADLGSQSRRTALQHTLPTRHEAVRRAGQRWTEVCGPVRTVVESAIGAVELRIGDELPATSRNAGRRRGGAPADTIVVRGARYGPDTLLDWLAAADPTAVADLFADLSAADIAVLLDHDHSAVGTLDGAPGWVRHGANRRVLDDAIAQLEAETADLRDRLPRLPRGRVATNPRELREAEATLDALLDLRTRAGLQLLVFEPVTGRVAAAIGDVDRAQHLGTFVPGTGSSLEKVGSYLDVVTSIGGQARDELERRSLDPAVATTVWLDLDSPSWPFQPMSSARAVEAAPDLASFTAGLAVANPGAGQRLIGHSYGSTVVGETAVSGHVPADGLVGLASPGMRADHAHQFQIATEGEVYVITDTRGGRNPLRGDVIHSVSPRLLTPALGSDPTTDDFGALRPPAVGDGGHSARSYVHPESDALRSLGLIVAGLHDELEEAAR